MSIDSGFESKPRSRIGRTSVDEAPSRARKLVPPRPWRPRVLGLLGFLFVGGALCLRLVPWQQSVVATGKVSVWSVMNRPQSVEALLPGRLVEWTVQEGDSVVAGQRLGLLEDIDSKFLDPDRLARVDNQIAAQQRRRVEELERVRRLEAQVDALEGSRGAQIPAADERIRQARRRRDAAEKGVEVARKNVEIARQAARALAAERIRKAEIALGQSRQSETAAIQELETETLRRERIGRLLAAGLRSRQEDEFAERDLVLRRTRREQARQSVEAAERDLAIAKASLMQVDLEIQRSVETLLQAQAVMDVAERDIAVARFDRSRVGADTEGVIQSTRGNVQAARASLSAIDDTLAKLELERSNMNVRAGQQEILAPVDGRIVRIGSTVGPGQTVKAGDLLATVAPRQLDQAVELTLRGADAPLVHPGRRVRLQFNGFPAIQISGFPQAAVGTFAGEVTVIDRLDDGSGNVRAWVRPVSDQNGGAGFQEKPWPASAILRPGTDVVAWVLLDRVPLGYELWRQFNAFPPNFRAKDFETEIPAKDGDSKGVSASKGFKPPKSDIKLPKR